MSQRARSRERHSLLGHWVPLFLIGSIATAGIATWIWRERSAADDSDSDDDPDTSSLSYGEGQGSARPGKGKRRADPPPPGYDVTMDERGPQMGVIGSGEGFGSGVPGEETLMARMAGAMKRTPSPQQMIDAAGKRVQAGMAAAGAMVGGALGAIREEGKDSDYVDHERWEEEVGRRGDGAGTEGSMKEADPRKRNIKRRTVAIVVSAEAGSLEEEEGSYSEQASLLSHLNSVDHDSVNLLILIYAPHLSSPPTQPASLASSYSAISTPAITPASELQPLTPALSATDLSASASRYNILRAHADRLVDAPTCVMPFASPAGHLHMLRHLAPDVVYLTEGLAGADGDTVEKLGKWVGQIVVVLGGDGEWAGLADTDTEDEGRKRREESGVKWWEDQSRVGLGRGLEVVEGMRLAEDFERRVVGRE
ncbi:hypothetical protein P152DRAFT_437783 [Eremomyces bilateralis CBS 781.70]|uniref:Peroxin 22-like protein n=1 Tax=Eremomyces bilateralis CBS 781.70 TaxID=1392243 RepID=A0A6G1G0H4_9PEZI|nr:uncharacterized protein P152DRAFT_437783 [Eremomyces bilateralis CBS 781.70]KAF1811426.1 hypothetical protein P152DRAFT_437783 [Eremomyces bilateralis CBS 781.70]